jgi:methionyl-tRNA formyltransferase
MITVLSKLKHSSLVARALPRARLVTELSDLQGGECLIAYGTGVIVPASGIDRYICAYNFHGASYLYPGRDSHHWAAYEGATEFGATAHVMTALVDAGPIVGSSLKPVPPGSSPSVYRAIGDLALAELFLDLAPRMALGTLPPLSLDWGPKKRSRAHTLKMCDFTGLPDAEKIIRRRAFQGFEAYFKETKPAP